MFISPDHIPLRDSDLNLDISGVAGFFGGDVAVSAMSTVHIYKGRKWLGWYNSPGSYEIAKRYGRLAARSRFFGGLYPGSPIDPAVLFELDGTAGPRYRGVRSGTVMSKTGHLAHLLLQECKHRPEEAWAVPAGARETTPSTVTVAHLHHRSRKVFHPHNERFSSYVAVIPIFASVTTAVMCALTQDWLCFYMIVLGMLCSGVSCWLIAQGVFTFTRPKSAVGSPPGDGILESGGQMVILLGREDAVNPITRGQFSLEYKSAPKHINIGISSLLLTVQFLVQLLVVPQGEIFGQIMFLCSLAVSWIYNSYLSSLDKESIQRRILVNQVLKKPRMMKYKLGTRTTVVVFVLLVLSESKDMDAVTLEDVLHDLLPNDTRTWRLWKSTVIEAISQMAHSGERSPEPFPASLTEQASELNDSDRKLLESLFTDARTAYAAFLAYMRYVPLVRYHAVMTDRSSGRATQSPFLLTISRTTKVRRSPTLPAQPGRRQRWRTWSLEVALNIVAVLPSAALRIPCGLDAVPHSLMNLNLRKTRRKTRMKPGMLWIVN